MPNDCGLYGRMTITKVVVIFVLLKLTLRKIDRPFELIHMIKLRIEEIKKEH